MANISFGIPKGVKAGDIFPDRISLVEARLHRSPQRGIDGNGDEGTAAIVLSGGYKDDYDYGDEILYTGEGGNDPATGRQVKDQTISSAGNAGLIVSMGRKLPVRVIRSYKCNSPFSPKTGYRFDGLFYVKEYKITTGKDGFKIIQYKLLKATIDGDDFSVQDGCIIELEYTLNGESKTETRSIGVINSSFKKINTESNYAKVLLGKKVGDDFKFGNIKGEIKSIKKYLQ
jgi:putative restriction endonuclease